MAPALSSVAIKQSPMAQYSNLSDKSIPANQRLILALDVPTDDDARKLVAELGDSVQFYKVGLELIIGGHYIDLVDELVNAGKKVMLDGKFFDVPETVRSAVRQAGRHNITFATVHGNDSMLKAAVEEKNEMQILAVTVLTSLDDADLKDLGFKCGTEDLVLSRARRAIELGCAGVIASGQEAPALREKLGGKFLIVSPGIRPVKNMDDQKRTVDVEEAFKNGADYIVVGRPIRQHQGFKSPRESAESIQSRIAALFP